jgi:integrase
MTPSSDNLKQTIRQIREAFFTGRQKKYRMKRWADLAPRTREKYSEIVEKMLREGLPVPADYARAHGLSKSQYQFCRAAVIQICSEKLRYLSELSHIDKDELLTTAALGKMAYDGKYSPPRYKTKSQKRNSKKYNLPKYEGWFETIHDELADQYKTPWAISYCTGLRPDELMTGVKIVRTHDRLSFLIWGSKRSKQNGSRWRRIELDLNEPAAQLVMQSMTGLVLNYKLNPSQKQPKEAFAMAVRRAAARAGLDADISPYVCRHSFAARLKKAGYSEIEIAMAMGQRSTATQSNYGGRGAVGGGGLPERITNSGEEIRQPVNRLEELKRLEASMGMSP